MVHDVVEEVSVLSQSTKDLIDNDTFRARAWTKREASAQRKHASVRATEPGACLVNDGELGCDGAHPLTSRLCACAGM